MLLQLSILAHSKRLQYYVWTESENGLLHPHGLVTKKKINPLWEINFPHSLGLLYSSFTYYCGFKVNSGEYKLMGLAPYGEPKYVDKIKKF